MRFFLVSLLLVGLGFGAGEGRAATDCAAGQFVAEAQIVPPSSIGNVMRATQFAWDGGQRLVQVCTLTDSSGSNFTNFWDLFSGEIDREFSGICVRLAGTNGTDMYSCATAAAVQRAFQAVPGSTQDRLIFNQWAPGIQANITQ